MRKLIVALLLCFLTVIAWRAYDRGDDGLAYDRFWIDHLPSGPKDKFNTLVLSDRHRFGIFGAQTPWLGQWEAFRFSSRESGKLNLVFPSKDERETVTVRARKCNENGFDYCLELSGGSRGVRRYYSKREWDKSGIQDPLSEIPISR